MQITEIEVTRVSCPLERVVHGSTYVKDRRSTVIVTVETADGTVGRTYAGDERDGQETLARLIEEEAAPHALGEDLFATERYWEAAMAHSSAVADRSLYMHALGALDAARWDAIGTALSVPLYELWGGYRDELPAIAIGGYYEEGKTLDDLVDEMEAFRDLGFAGVKLKVGGRSPERDLERLRAVREAMGEAFVIACDANQGWSAGEAVAFAEGATEYGIRWLEEPVVWNDQYRGMREVRRRTDVPVCAGQSEITPEGCRRLLDADAVDILNFDASLAGGPTGWRRAADAASLAGVEMAHHEEPHIAMHLLAAVPHGLYVECFHPEVDPVWYEMIDGGPTVENGTIGLPDGPGFGIDLDADFVETYAVE